MKCNQTLRRTLTLAAIPTALAVALAGCGGSPAEAVAQDARGGVVPAATPPSVALAMSETEMVDQLALSLQACSYDGSPVTVDANGMGGNPPTDCRDMVARIMNFTGLPQNFHVVEANVPNAAALIVLGPDKLPRRVIAFNKNFMDEVRRATGNNDWAPVSIMAHEIGHHLSGHTITPGGSQPPIELEADKFSGFVLYKMGAQLVDAQKAMVTLVPEGDGPTHPGRGKRVAAIEDGWKQACLQQGGTRCSSGVAPPIAQNQSPVVVAPASSAGPITSLPTPAHPATAGVTPDTVAVSAPAPGGVRDVLPAVSASATPSKFSRFVYDETGMVEPVVRAKVEKAMFDHAQAHGVEIVTLVVDDLDGLDANAYAQAMLRQLRVGKLDVGNGVVLVYAPKVQQAGLAMGPGVALATTMVGSADVEEATRDMRRVLSTIAFSCKHGCRGGASEMFFGRSDRFRRDTDNFDWTIPYQSYGQAWTTFKSAWDTAMQRGVASDPNSDPTRGKIVRMQGTVLRLNPPTGDKAAWVSTVRLRQGFLPLQVQVAEGHKVVLYVDPNTQGLMPGGALAQGRRYAFITRVDNFTWNTKDTQSLDVLSYDQLD
ncbi:TPM domain-containing protein [Montanilutibacter psychrotolerans]|uniref:TPM domain-containing protein n=1 Tax=Montanilutibacter psychrotolerans TaxID=1327343 RepID=A0A3M8T1P4_9GAMM|nr:TPM domain-containing protein [Lysobacter psychrotolerans]RNF85030.1 hypothetical protein EER27_04370 [Lysobacter psychrotolerans]